MKHEKDKLILLVGASGSGKTTIAKELEGMEYNIIHSYTTRQPREPNEWGYTFVKQGVTCATMSGNILKKWYMEDEKTSEVIAYFKGYGYEYWATKEQYQGKGTSIYTVCPDGADQVKQNVKDAEVITIFLMADIETRCQRMYMRKFPDTDWNWRMNPELVLPRIRQDEKIFSKCKCNYVVDANRELEEVISDVKQIIGGI